VENIDLTRRGEFSFQAPPGFDLRGKTFGVIGTGDIGRRVIEIARGFGMEVLAFNRTRYEEMAAELGFTYVDLDELLQRSDVVTLHVPATSETHHMISGDEFEKMKEGVILINTARGSIVDVQSLAQALTDGKVKAAGLDVLPEEPVIREEAELLGALFRDGRDPHALLADHVLMRLRNVIITPHTAFYTREALKRIVRTTGENIRAFARGEPLNIVVGGNQKE
jgi:D-lactate dehydrogenase